LYAGYLGGMNNLLHARKKWKYLLKVLNQAGEQNTLTLESYSAEMSEGAACDFP
jgi:hypothetical protein